MLLALIALLAQTPAAAAAAPAPSPREAAGAEPVICKRIVPTGTRLGGRQVCATKSQWERLSAVVRRT